MPKYSYQKLNYLNLDSFASIFGSFKKVLYFLIEYYIPKTLGHLIDLFFGNIPFKDFIFLRCDCDHFGPWTYVFLFTNSKGYNPKKDYYLIAKKGSIQGYWLTYFKKKNLHIIYNPTLKRLISPFFFSVNHSIDLNGYNYISFSKNKKSYRNFKKMPTIDDAFLKNLKLNSTNKRALKEDIFSRELIIFNPRFGRWNYSIRNSRRNMTIKAAKKLIKVLVKKYNVFLVDSENFDNLGKNVFTLKSLKNAPIKLSEIYKNSFCVIGSVSGGTHFPSLVFNKPTLYIADIPLHHLKAIYLLPSGGINKKMIPSKDNWLMISRERFEQLSEGKYREIIEKIFFNSKDTKEIDGFKTYICKGSDNNEEPLLQKNNNGNIFFENSINL